MTSTIRWVEVPDTTPTLPYTSGIQSLDMVRDKFAQEGLGEVRGARRPFTGQKAPNGFDGRELCGTEHEFEFGGKYEPDKPPAVYDSQGFLACCKVPAPPPPAVPYNFATTCNTSSPPYGVLYEGTITAGTSLDWWGSNMCVIGRRFRVTYNVPAGQTGWACGLFQGSQCGFSVYYIALNLAPGVYETPPLFLEKIWVTFRRPTPPLEAVVVSFKIEILPP